MSTLRGVGRAAAYGEADFEQQREIVGDCYALRLSAGEYWQRRGALGRAGGEYLAILRDNPRSLWARLRLGALATRRRRHAEAVAHYRAAVEEVPAFHLAHTLLGSALLRGRRRAEAAASFERARALDPHD